MSCLRIRSLIQYSITHNATYDTLSSAIWSSVEINVGVICICMPALRRFLSYVRLKCSGTTTKDSIVLYGDAPSRLLSGKKSSRKKSALPSHLFDTTIVKTIDTRVLSAKAEEDELQLMDMGINKSATKSAESVEQETSEAGSCEKEQHQRNITEGW
jgi:hypothetical protein